MIKPGKADTKNLTERAITVSRSFKAPRQKVFDYLTQAEFIKQWMLGPPGWTMVVCEIDLQLAGKYHYVWQQNSDGQRLGLGGVFRVVKSPEVFAAYEKYDEPWHAGQCFVTTALGVKNDETILLTTMQYESKEIRDSVLKTPMLNGLVTHYDNLTKLLAN